MEHMEIIFLLLIGIVFYCWVVYPLMLKLLSVFYAKGIKKEDCSPHVTVLLTVFNEEKVIRNRIENLLALQYPGDKLDILVASDGSTDKTHDIVKEFDSKGVQLFVASQRKGKSITQNEAVSLAHSDILVFTDADTVFDTRWLEKIVRPFADPSVGCVSGQLLLRKRDNSISESQGVYYKYETALRMLESKIGILSTAIGPCMAIRRKLFKPLDGQYGDDCIIPLDIISQGYRVIHEPEAIANDIFPSSIHGELKTRIRMTLRNWTGTLSRKHLLNPFKYPFISFSLISHRILRWLTPYLLLLIFIANLLLLENPWFFALFLLQVIFYVLSFIGFFLEKKAIHLRVFTVPFSFCLANLGMFLGVLKCFFGYKIITYRADK